MQTKALITVLALGLTIGVVAQAGARMNGPGNQEYMNGPMVGRQMESGYGMPENMGRQGTAGDTTEQLKRAPLCQ